MPAASPSCPSPVTPLCIAVFLVVVLVVVATRFSLATCIPRIAKAHRELTEATVLGEFGSVLVRQFAVGQVGPQMMLPRREAD